MKVSKVSNNHHPHNQKNNKDQPHSEYETMMRKISHLFREMVKNHHKDGP